MGEDLSPIEIQAKSQHDLLVMLVMKSNEHTRVLNDHTATLAELRKILTGCDFCRDAKGAKDNIKKISIVAGVALAMALSNLSGPIAAVAGPLLGAVVKAITP